MEGWQTQSLDGAPIAPLMGRMRDLNAGAVARCVHGISEFLAARE